MPKAKAIAKGDMLPIETIVVIAQGFLNEERGYSFRLKDGTRMFIPAHSDEEVAEMWKNITTAVWGNEDFFLYYRSLINMSLISEVLKKTEGVDQPTLILRFQDGFEFHSPYESMVLMEKDHGEILALLSQLGGQQSSIIPPTHLH